MSVWKQTFTALAIMTLLTACGGEDRAGQPETETTDTMQTASQTSTDAATATASTGGTISNLPAADKEFVSNAGLSGLAEVQMGNLGLQKAVNPDVKAYAQRMVTDHSASNTELSQLATTKGLALPTELTGEPKSGMDHLSGLTGGEFDKAYMQHMVGDHEKAVAEFDRASTSVSDAEIKAFATKNLPILREHLAQAKEIAGKL
jgi:putative membrane protein